jgi:hypothetical protein
MADPRQGHWQAAKGILRYLCGTVSYGIKFNKESSLLAFCDSDYASDLATRRSTTGFVFILNGGAIAWGSKLQPTVAASTTEAEYQAAAVAVKEALWLRKLFADLNINGNGSTIAIFCDSQGAVKLLNHPIASVRSKHIDVIHHFARERVARKEVNFISCSTTGNLADGLTKPLPQHKFEACRMGMGVTDG